MKYQKLQIFRPTLSSRVTQWWGENKACYDDNGRVYGVAKRCPIGTSVYETMGMKGHNGLDIAGPKGEEIYHAATFAGWWRTERDLKGGVGVDIVSNEPLFFASPIPPELRATAVPHEQDGVKGFLHYVKMRYWHLNEAIGYNKKEVTCGTVVGTMGNTGISSGVHLHFAPKWCLSTGESVADYNGYFGAFDPTPYINLKVTAVDHSKYMNVKQIPLTTQERRDMLKSLSAAEVLLLSLRKLLYKI